MERIEAIPLAQAEREQRRRNSDCAELWQWLDAVSDPEIPVLSLWDMGILRNVERDGNRVVVTVTPTYSGCPAMETIRDEITWVMTNHGIPDCEVCTQLAPPWTSDWMTDKARRQLHRYGIAPPALVDSDGVGPAVVCPHCGSEKTHRVSEFGSTTCKALYQCDACGEPFDYFKRF